MQQSKISEHEITLKVAVDYISAALHVAIFEDNEEGILEVLKSMLGNQTLRQKVNETLDNQQKAYLTERQASITENAKLRLLKSMKELLMLHTNWLLKSQHRNSWGVFPAPLS